MIAQPIRQEPADRAQLRKAILASAVGTIIEWYDFFLYGFAAALVFPKLFFPHSDPATGMLLAFSTFFVGFVARPIGAAIFGHYGDRIGRKATLVATLIMMGASTVAIGLVPSYAKIGVWGGILLTALRALQGIGLGGEWAGSVLLSIEWGKEVSSGRRGFLAALPQLGVPIGVLLGNGALALMGMVAGSGFDTWGWRIPFLASGALIVIGLWIRLGILETPMFAELIAQKEPERAPVLAVLQQNWREVILTALARTSQMGAFYLFTTLILTYGTTVLRLPQPMIVTDVLLSATISLFTIPFFGHLSDRLGRRRQYLWGNVVMLIFAFAYYAMLDTRSPLWVGLAILVSLPVHDMQYAPLSAFIAEAFPTKLRYSGASLGFQLAAITSGGPAPLIALALLDRYHTSVAISVFMAVCAVISFGSAALLPDRTRDEQLPD
ncbi:MAG: MHS family MFS transporter [Cyanobacteria bacterium REEB65]|nr:MHS family MFS transporter [Cyanobacteria bacterium REEB65]